MESKRRLVDISKVAGIVLQWMCRGLITYQIGLRERRDVSLLLLIVKGIHGEEDLTRYRLIVTLVTVTNVYTLATHFPMNP